LCGRKSTAGQQPYKKEKKDQKPEKPRINPFLSGIIRGCVIRWLYAKRQVEDTGTPASYSVKKERRENI
jgi:hypothetical protein